MDAGRRRPQRIAVRSDGADSPARGPIVIKLRDIPCRRFRARRLRRVEPLLKVATVRQSLEDKDKSEPTVWKHVGGVSCRSGKRPKAPVQARNRAEEFDLQGKARRLHY